MKTRNFPVLTIFVIFVFGGFIFGCASSITHKKIMPSNPQEEPGFSYFLPQQKFLVTVTYELMTCPKNSNQNSGDSTVLDLKISQTATLVEETEADVNEHYLLTYESLNAPLKTSTFDAKTYPNQTLKSVGATITDTTAAVIKNITGTAINVAKMVLGVPSGFTKSALNCNKDTIKALKSVSDGEAIIMDPSKDSSARAAAAEAITHAKTKLRIVLRKELTPSWENLSESLKVEDDQLKKWLEEELITTLAANRNSEGNKTLISSISTELAAFPKQQAASPDPTNINAGKGVIYRDPLPTKVLVCTPSCSAPLKKVAAVLNTQIAQLGRKKVITLENRAFDTNNVSLSFAANGVLESMMVGKESSLEQLTGALTDTSTQAQGFLEAKRKKDSAEKEAEKNSTLNSIKAEVELLKAKSDRIEAENKLRSLGGDPTK